MANLENSSSLESTLIKPRLNKVLIELIKLNIGDTLTNPSADKVLDLHAA
ncbi:hypothetical protein IMPR6_80075 [Imperialibacter sp. EC-SDR9]|nr:hypothetical protein IMPERIA75_200075 [Imperialibacter sp. 75]CAD5262583.1 hypothetical protein IMPERIA89_290076 [Imperialibacter sp. 89]VVT35281.1 hypothetical protein IMPR6_80075 [Imperialibacter sp. EC-SDR9]